MRAPIIIEVLGEPKGQPRPKAFARKFTNGAVMARVYDPKTAEGWKSQIAQSAKDKIPFIPLEGPIRLDIEFRFSRPKSHYLKSGLRPNAPHWHTCKPDRDNCEKAVMDALTTLGLWKDDAQVCSGEVKKVYAGRVLSFNIHTRIYDVDCGEETKPGASIKIEPLGEPAVYRLNQDRQPEMKL